MSTSFHGYENIAFEAPAHISIPSYEDVEQVSMEIPTFLRASCLLLKNAGTIEFAFN